MNRTGGSKPEAGKGTRFRGSRAGYGQSSYWCQNPEHFYYGRPRTQCLECCPEGEVKLNADGTVATRKGKILIRKDEPKA